MNNPDTPVPAPRPYVPRIVDPIDGLPEPETKFQPRYVEVPALREHGFGRRNLAWGVITLVLGLGLLVAAVYLAGQKAVLSLAACLFTFTALFVLARLHVFRQRNGGFLAVTVVVLLGAVVPLVDYGYEKLSGSHAVVAPAGLVTVPAVPVEVEPPLLSQSFALTKPDPSETQVRVLKDSRVLIGEKPFLIKVGDAFPLLEAKGGEVTFAVRDLHVSLPVTVVEISGGKAGKETRETAMQAALAAAASSAIPKLEPVAAPTKVLAEAPKVETDNASAELAAVTRGAQQEAIRRYPALAIKDSKENAAFLAAHREMKQSGNTEFFSNPEWPIELAEVLAVRNRWTRGDQPAPAGATIDTTPKLEPPMDDEDVPVAVPVTETRLPQLLPPTEDLPKTTRRPHR
ncbi:MAG: hypothetical protein K8R23_10990 [Chthoniobacter sp.]|nr:hypothetical protein [Chthoniobacter sp.]